jgi:hypothetical protein
MRKDVPIIDNIGFKEWLALVLKEFDKRGMQPLQLHPKRHLHGYEGGDTPYAWVDFLVRQQEMQRRSIAMRRDNPEHYK